MIIDRLKQSRFRKVFRCLALSNPWRVLPTALKIRLIACSPLIDPDWVGQVTGFQGGRRELAKALVSDSLSVASPLLGLDWYRSRYGLDATAGEALLHYWFVGDYIGLRPHPWFDPVAARLSNARRRPTLKAVLAQYLSNWREFNAPHALFDQVFYLTHNDDVREGGFNPLIHFVLYGEQEGRRPNEYFDPAWYRSANPDVASSGMAPSLHFGLYGAAEGRSPGPDFDSFGYVVALGRSSLGGWDPLSHYLVIGRPGGIRHLKRDLSVGRLTGPVDGVVKRRPHAPVDVIVPVYRGLEETRTCIESVLDSLPQNMLRLHIYNDASPEPEITEFLRALVVENDRLIYVENDENLGFVKTVNKAMKSALLFPDFDSVILLNSDTEVSGDWVARLRGHVDANSDVATVTAMSNNATICSYPQLGANVVPEGETAGSIDSLAAVTNAGLSVELPTGVGFCMLITAEALRKVGLFDEEAFGKGYGEEVDFCQRAMRNGMKNLLALDVYVKHAGEVSFTTSSKPSKLIGEEIIRERYPEYAGDVTNFVRGDPGLHGRIRLTFARWRALAIDVRVLFTHALGGGTERHVQDVARATPCGSRTIVIRPVQGYAQRMRVECPHVADGFAVEVDVENAHELSGLLLAMGAGRIQIHHVLGFNEVLRKAIAISGLPFDFVAHDYFVVCPQVTLTDASGNYCGEPALKGCDECISMRPSHGSSDIRNWRIHNEWLVLGASALAAPSEDCASRMQRYFRRAFQVAPHEDLMSLSTFDVPAASRTKRRVVLFGALAPHKGRRLVLALAEEVLKRSLPLEIHLIGDPQGEVPRRLSPVFSSSGRYDDSKLDDLVVEAQPDIILFASQAPETYSYTLTTALRSGVPIVATHLGAFIERLAGNDLHRTFPPTISAGSLADLLLSIPRVQRS
jgi:GT2 family glycosyltransferase